MKLSEKQQLTIGEKRTLQNVDRAIVSLLQTKPLESIKVSDICEGAMIPRSTFYNYYNDKFDVVKWMLISRWKALYPEQHTSMDFSAEVDNMWHRIYGFYESARPGIMKIFQKNPPDGEFFRLYQTFLTESIDQIYQNCTASAAYQIPLELVSKACAAVSFTIIQWGIIEGHASSEQELLEQCHYLLPRSHS